MGIRSLAAELLPSALQGLQRVSFAPAARDAQTAETFDGLATRLGYLSKAESDYEGRPPVHEIAGAGRIVDFARRDDGRFDLLLHGLTRVRLDELPAEGLAYRRARCTPLPDRVPHPAAVERMLPDVLGAASALATIVRQRHPRFELGVDRETPPGIVADRIADRLIADVARRQALLEQPDVKVRLALLHEALLDLLAGLAPAGGPVH